MFVDVFLNTSYFCKSHLIINPLRENMAHPFDAFYSYKFPVEIYTKSIGRACVIRCSVSMHLISFSFIQCTNLSHLMYTCYIQ